MDKLAQLRAKKAEAIAGMNAIIEERGENLDQTNLDAIKTFKSDIENLDRVIEGIETVRSIAISKVMTPEAKDKQGQIEVRAAFEDFLRMKITDKEYEKRTMQSGAAGAGAETVPDEFYKQLQETVLEFSNFLADTMSFTTGNNGTLTIPMMDDTENSGAWIDEGGEIPLNDASTDDRTMSAYKEGSGIKVSTELIEDAFFNLSSWVAVALGVRLARTYNSAFINGDGLSKPLGILADGATIDVPSKESETVTLDDTINLRYAIPAASRIGAAYYASDAFYKLMETWRDENGRPILQPAAEATDATGVRHTLGGYPVKLNTELGDPTVEGDSPLIFGNAKRYWVRMTRNVKMTRDDYSAMNTDEVIFYATTRLDGKLANENPYFAKVTVSAVIP